MNLCAKCLPSGRANRTDVNFFDFGKCSSCGAPAEVVDVELVDLYDGLGLSPDFVHAHLPRLRVTPDGTVLTMRDIGQEIARHAAFGKCTDHPCQGYVDRPWKWEGSRKTC